ncbi:hypothetical protein [uncultured Pseudoalteromonas sp.]|uniref:hypothetical protein n=1 Tax=uncultured Pseudoalteromonas sp. TaxID=114053 RepID=UPI002596DC0A|nr:hypothetical protein [uncultured Pseudoalteromonas sp.]
MGLGNELKAEDGVLYAKADEVSSEFAQAVEDKRYPNRSVKLEKVENGYKLAHIGYLGGKPPAFDGLAWQFNQDENADTLTFEFASGDMDSISQRTSNTLTRLMGNLRNFIIVRFSSEAAEKFVPDSESEWLKEEAISEIHFPQLNALAAPSPISCNTTNPVPYKVAQTGMMIKSRVEVDDETATSWKFVSQG